MACTDFHKLYDDKPLSLTANASIFLGVDDDGDTECLNAIIRYFNTTAIPVDELNENFYLISGKIASVDKPTYVGPGFDPMDFAFEAEVQTVRAPYVSW